jgi:hypothetical protein
VRHGPSVERERFDDLGEAVAELERRVKAIRAEGGLEPVSSLRDFSPSEQVHARLELSTGGWVRRRDAGLDLMGDGSLVPYSGGIRRERLEASDDRTPFELVREALA